MSAAADDSAPGRFSAFSFPGRQHAPQVGAFLVVVLAQLVVFLTVVVNPNLLPGNWTPLVPSMEFYFFSGFLALFVFAFTRGPSPGGPVEVFMVRFGAGVALTWLVLTVVFYGSVALPTVSGGQKILYLVYTALFIAPVEEVLFRAALPRIMPWFLSTAVLFPLYHVPAYLLEYQGATPEEIVANIAFVAVLGVVLWFAYTLPWPTFSLVRGGPRYRLGGLGFAIGVHFLYDVFVFGAVLSLPIALTGLGLTPV